MRKNYHQVRKQKELARKVRQDEKQQRRAARLGAATVAPAEAAPEGDAQPAPDPGTHGAS